jgi:hypothetical protein
VINVVPGAAGHPDAISGKGDAKRTRAGRLIVPDIKDEIVLDDVIVSAAQIDSIS